MSYIKKRIILFLSLIILVLPLAGCLVTPANPPVIVAFSATPSSITAGSSTTLLWVVTGATSVSINPDIGSVALGGTTSISPKVSTSYTLKATSKTGTSTAQIMVTVTQPAPVILDFAVSPTIITAGQSANLMWNVSGASSVSISPGIGSVALSGSQEVSPVTSVTYVLTATNSYGTNTSTAVLTVNPTIAPPVSNNFNVSPTIIDQGGYATIYWNVTGATSVRIDPGIGDVAASGSQTVSPDATTTYILTATDADCNCIISDDTTLTVRPYYTEPYYFPPPYYPVPSQNNRPVIIDFSINPPIETSGGTATMEWNVSGATSIVINNKIGKVASTGSLALHPAATTHYILTATNKYGSSTASAIVKITASVPKAAPVIKAFTASPKTIAAGHSCTLSWSVARSTSVHINHGVGAVSHSGSIVVSPSHTTTYTLTASNSGGMVQHTVTVTVQ
jgi:hypothetical protein